MPTPKPKAAQRYERRLAEVNAEIAKLRAKLKKHAAQQKKYPEDWSFSGDLQHVADRISTVTDFLTRMSK